jgi:rare lipoprotein A (peptidoglycan hydrolase)
LSKAALSFTTTRCFLASSHWSSLQLLYSAFSRSPQMQVAVSAGVSMRASSVVGLIAAILIASSAQEAHSRGFPWFFSHSRPHGNCAGQNAVATYYVSGRRTASGLSFNPNGYTAAHRTLPFGSQVTVTNPENGRSITVTINDRGPFCARRCD